MDVDSEDTSQEMEGETGEESMATEYQDSNVLTMTEAIENNFVAMATDNGEMLEADGECDSSTNKNMNGEQEGSLFAESGCLHSNKFGDFSKRIESPGYGYFSPKDGTMCNISLNILNLGSIPLEEVGFCTGDNIVIVIGEGDTVVARQLDIALQTMKQGEVSDVFIFVKAIADTISVSNMCSFKVEMLSFQDPMASWQLLPGEKISRAAHHKEKGTTLFQQGKIESAFWRFSKAQKYLICCHPEESIPENCQDVYLKLKCQCYSNMAACQMKASLYKMVTENCSKALEIDSKNIKALYRRGQAHFNLGNFELSQADMQMILTLEPENKAVLPLLNQLEVQQRQVDSKLAVGLSKMFT